MPTDLSAPLPDLNLQDQSILTVDAGDSSAVITLLTIHLSQDVPDDLLPVAPLPPLMSYVATPAP